MNKQDQGLFCLYGGSILSPLFDQFIQQVEGIRLSKDPEYIHDLRVASRRLRAALSVFGPCFPNRSYRRWIKEIRYTANALGRVRDRDVQICFLRETISNTRESYHRPGMEYLLRLLLFGRDTLQDSIRETLDRLENTRITQDFRNLTALPQDPGDRAYKRDPFLCSRARHDIRRRIEDLVRFEEALQDPESKEGHHEMRIAAKRLRYTMEVYSPLLEGELMPAIITMRNFQDALGELHDTDVWIGLLPRFLEEGQSFPGNAGEQSQLTALIEPGILHLLRECRATRTRQYAKALGQWKEIRAEKTIEGIQAVLLPGAEAQKAMQPERKSGGDKKRLDQVVRVAENYRYEEEHSRHVTSLALALFDDLITLHRMGSTQKKWLHFAGILHDIGYFRSEKGHQKKGLALVLADSDLPFTPRERSIIGSIVRYHGTEKPTPRHVPFGRLSHKDQRRVSMLAAILRIADALDVSHEALISRIEPELQNDRVHLHCYAPYPSPSEESAFCRKKDLFETIFQRSVEMSWRAAA